MISIILRSSLEDGDIVTDVNGIYDDRPIAYRNGNPDIPEDIVALIKINETRYSSRKRSQKEIVRTRWVLED